MIIRYKSTRVISLLISLTISISASWKQSLHERIYVVMHYEYENDGKCLQTGVSWHYYFVDDLKNIDRTRFHSLNKKFLVVPGLQINFTGDSRKQIYYQDISEDFRQNALKEYKANRSGIRANRFNEGIQIAVLEGVVLESKPMTVQGYLSFHSGIYVNRIRGLRINDDDPKRKISAFIVIDYDGIRPLTKEEEKDLEILRPE